MGTVHDLVIHHGYATARTMVPASEQRLVDIAADILGEESLSLNYMYSGFAMTALPHRRLANKDDIWERKNGRFSLLIEPGHIFERGAYVHYGVPFGARARLILLYLQTEAIQSNSRVVRLGRSMYDWMERMGVPVGGSSYAAVRDQARRLSACRLTVGWVAKDGSEGFTRENIVSTVLTTPVSADPRQAVMWDETAELTEGFFRALREHPVPVWEPAIRVIQNSSAVMDVYIWLCYRLRALQEATTVPWTALHAQFGKEYKTLRQFRHKFLITLKEALAVYPGANVEVAATGVRLLPSRPAIPERKIVAVAVVGATGPAEPAPAAPTLPLALPESRPARRRP